MTANLTAARLAAMIVVVALTALGCGDTKQTADPPSRAHRGHLKLHALGDRPPRNVGGGPLDTSRPTIGRLDPHLLAALQAAARNAQRDGVRIVVTSGWRSRAHQERLFAAAVRKYGSEVEASRYVATPDSSAHVTGDAVDIGPTAAADWLSRHGAEFGLCQIFANEIWHFELATTPGGRCPNLLTDGRSRR